MMRHVLGILGVLAAAILLAVSAAMNWRFGYSIGNAEFDRQLYGAASAAADCFKALVPFFFFAAIRNKMWSQALASFVIWGVVTAYSLTSALGHVTSNRSDTGGHRQAIMQTYQDHRADLKRAQDQLSWIPQHRPVSTVESAIDALKTQRLWTTTESCTQVSGRQVRDFCQGYHGLLAERASAMTRVVQEARIAEIQAKLEATNGGGMLTEADPQAAALATMTGLTQPQVQMAMAIFVALLLEIGSGFGMYVAFSQWRVYESYAPTVRKTQGTSATAEVSLPLSGPLSEPLTVVPLATVTPVVVVPTVGTLSKPHSNANDNKVSTSKRLLPENDVQRYYRECVEDETGATVSAAALYEDYCLWCKQKKKESLAKNEFHYEFQDTGNVMSQSSGRNRYMNIAIKRPGATPGIEKKGEITVADGKKVAGPVVASAKAA